jgi:neutral ceramidase
MTRGKRQFAVLCVAFCSSLSAADYKAGVGRVIITPDKPIYMSGYASRNHPSEGVIHDLWAKALAIEDGKGERVVIVTTDLIGLPRSIADIVAARIQKQYGIDRAQLVLSSSHTHTGPLIRHNLENMFELGPEDSQVVTDYAASLTEKLVAVAGSALNDLEPANLWFGNGRATFAINRRQNTPKGVIIGEDPAGPTDPDVPVLKVTGADGKLRAVLFGYACHNTTLNGDFYRITGDYAGFTQIAMFIMLCGADQNPHPRSTLGLAQQHGKELATEVDRVLGEKLSRVHGPVRGAFQIVELGFAPQSREGFEARLNDANVHRVRHAKAMLRLYDDGNPIRRYPYPVQAIQFGKDLTLVALGGEVVVDYVLRIKREYGSKGIMVAAYSNDVMSYIPSLRVLKEGGYEANDSMLYYGLPGPYDEEVEDHIMNTVHQVIKRVGRPAVQ